MKRPERQPVSWWDTARQIAFGSADRARSHQMLLEQWEREHRHATPAERDDAHRRIAQLCGV
jgi:hypothetical protein